MFNKTWVRETDTDKINRMDMDLLEAILITKISHKLSSDYTEEFPGAALRAIGEELNCTDIKSLEDSFTLLFWGGLLHTIKADTDVYVDLTDFGEWFISRHLNWRNEFSWQATLGNLKTLLSIFQKIILKWCKK